jgi:hypothetical protein
MEKTKKENFLMSSSHFDVFRFERKEKKKDDRKRRTKLFLSV